MPMYGSSLLKADVLPKSSISYSIIYYILNCVAALSCRYNVVISAADRAAYYISLRYWLDRGILEQFTAKGGLAFKDRRPKIILN